MSSSDAVETLLNYKNELKKHKDVSLILLKYYFIQDDDTIVQILKKIIKVEVTTQDIKIIKNNNNFILK